MFGIRCSVFECSRLVVHVRSDMRSCSGSCSVNICLCSEAVQPEHLFVFGERYLGAALTRAATGTSPVGRRPLGLVPQPVGRRG